MIRISQEKFDFSEIRRVYEDLVAPKVITSIKDFFAKEKVYGNHSDRNVRDAYKIVAAFLKRYGLDQIGAQSDRLKGNVLEYLLGGKDDPQRYLESIILSFWRVAADVCVDSINAAVPGSSIKYLDNAEVEALSKWEANIGEIGKEDIRAIDFLPTLTRVLYGGTEEKDQSENAGDSPNGDKSQGAKAKASGKTKGALDILAAIFNYDEMNRPLVKGTPRHQLMSAMRISVCPYCNRQYITIYSENMKGIGEETGREQNKYPVKKTTADLDHFYIKSQYPYLSLSIYNFIPSCQICNSRFKGTMDFYVHPHVYPYTEEFGDDVKFTMKLDTCLIDDKEKWEKMIELADGSGKEAVRNSISTFMLEQVYQSHMDYVQELRIKSNMYNKDMIAVLDKDYGGLLGDKRSILDLIFGQYLDRSQFHRRPLSKLTRDILEECYSDQIDWESI